ncbi:hypothetical protein UCRPC4_g00206 [Phaeomoniella chlamydospora]|uniref:Uncharacterized protein n=1 Tax=Phaeomoniella chlamydospora TaxID=158046 RepID=A0A0G2F2K5_PHACM|nr:hypothetical protein UCRPC4_g00206 [Phaeomoniella chlamydospora]
MASADVMPMATSVTTFEPLESSTAGKRKRSTDKVLIDVGALASVPKVPFDASKHVTFTSPSKVYTMKDLSLPEDCGISPVAVSEPFPLFSPEAIQQMRAEVLSKDVWENCQYSSNLSQCQLRGMAPEFAPFIYDAWRNPKVLENISKVAGVDLVPEMDFEIGHINISMQSEEQKQEALAAIAEKEARQADEGVAGCPWEDDTPIVDWHTDSYPFVCVLMLSDCTKMIGGETALRTGTGEVMKVRGPQMGCAVILQGRYIEHQALRALGACERITMVTSFRPKSAMIKDDTVLTTVRPISDLSELYFQYSEYRLEILEERLRAHLKDIRERKRANRSFDTASTKRFLKEQQDFLAAMNREMVDEANVIQGYCDDSHLLSEDLRAKSKKPRTASPEETT